MNRTINASSKKEVEGQKKEDKRQMVKKQRQDVKKIGKEKAPEIEIEDIQNMLLDLKGEDELSALLEQLRVSDDVAGVLKANMR